MDRHGRSENVEEDRKVKAFITGSYAYGRPNKKSDVDLVVFVDLATAEKLQEFSNLVETIRFGKLNIVLCFTEDKFNTWKTTTDRLVEIHRRTGAIFDKISATVEFAKDRRIFGVEYRGNSGSMWEEEMDKRSAKFVPLNYGEYGKSCPDGHGN